MFKRTKLWTSISAITLAGAATISVTGCETASNSEPGTETPVQQRAAVQSDAEHASMNMKMGAGEGEGEGSDESSVDLGTNDLAYLTQLSLMRGHLYVGYELYKAGHIEHAKTHMKHPESELYAKIAPAFATRNTIGFADELSALSAAVDQELSTSQVEDAYYSLSLAISKSENAVEKTIFAPAQRLKLVVELLRIAGEEYAIAVVDGQLQNAHEYQDALGFTAISRAITHAISSNQEAELKAKESALTILYGLQPLWPTLVPPESLTADASALYGAAARIELLALAIEQ